MHNNMIWRGFLLFLLAVTLWFTIDAIYLYRSYVRLRMQVPTTSIAWDVVENSSDNYTLKANYAYKVGNDTFTGSSPWDEAVYKNSWAAETQAKAYTSQPWKVWIDPTYPAHSALQKNFPLKQCVYSVVLWGIFLYFLSLGFYVANFKK